MFAWMCGGVCKLCTTLTHANTWRVCGTRTPTAGALPWWKPILRAVERTRCAVSCPCLPCATAPSHVNAAPRRPRAVRWPHAPQLFYDGDGSGEQEWVDLSGLMHQPPPSEAFAMRVVASLTPGSHATRQRYAALVRAEQLLCFCRRPERPGETVVRCGRRASPRQACCSPWCDAVCATRV